MASPLTRIRSALRLVGWNALLLTVGLGTVVGVGEIWGRSTAPFLHPSRPMEFVPKVGPLLKPNAEIRWTNHLDFWTISRTNSLGFLDREPLSPERAAASCHISVIGDSFVEAREVSITDKFHVLLESLTVRQLPHLNITTSAFGRIRTGQIDQLSYYDIFARHLSPKQVVLVFVYNDFRENARSLGRIPKSVHTTVIREEHGTIRLVPPDPDAWLYRGHNRLPLRVRIENWLIQSSYFGHYLQAKRRALLRPSLRDELMAWAELPTRRPPIREHLIGDRASNERLPAFEEAVGVTAFALNQFKDRIERDGGSLVILSTHTMGTRGSVPFDVLSALAEARGIPVIDQYDYILRQGGRIEEAHWAHDMHWNHTGHRWAMEALFEHLKQHPEICAGRRGDRTAP